MDKLPERESWSAWEHQRAQGKGRRFERHRIRTGSWQITVFTKPLGTLKKSSHLERIEIRSPHSQYRIDWRGIFRIRRPYTGIRTEVGEARKDTRLRIQRLLQELGTVSHPHDDMLGILIRARAERLRVMGVEKGWEIDTGKRSTSSIIRYHGIDYTVIHQGPEGKEEIVRIGMHDPAVEGRFNINFPANVIQFRSDHPGRSLTLSTTNHLNEHAIDNLRLLIHRRPHPTRRIVEQLGTALRRLQEGGVANNKKE